MKVKELLRFYNVAPSNATVTVHVFHSDTIEIEDVELGNYELVHIADKKFPTIPDVGNATLEWYQIRDGRMRIYAKAKGEG